MSPPTILLTGSTGFLGKALLQHFAERRTWSVIAASRAAQDVPAGVTLEIVGELDQGTRWQSVFRHPIDVVIHAAARAHIMRDVAVSPLREYRRVNVEGTLNLARCAAAAGVKRFVFISSIKVNGEHTASDKPFRPIDDPQPSDDYALSKLEAERGLWDIQRSSGMEIVIIRPVLMYGPGVKANFLSMMRWLHRGVPLPFGSIHNARSLLALDNAVSFVTLCVTHPQAANELFLLSDGDDVSTTTLLRELAAALGKRAWLLPVPCAGLMSCAGVLGASNKVRRLLGSLQVDIEKNRRLLGWKAPILRSAALAATASHFLNERS